MSEESVIFGDLIDVEGSVMVAVDKDEHTTTNWGFGHWKEYPEHKPDTSDIPPFRSKKFIVESNRGVSVATYHEYPRGWVFQDVTTNDDEGMMGYEVYRWMEFPNGKENS